MEGPRPTLRLASLRAGADFFDQLGDLWLDGGLDPAIPAPGDDPFALIDTTFLVPTRRAARLLGACLGAKLEARGLGGLLPVIHPIGDVEDRLDPADEDGGLHALRPAGRIEQRLLLARLIQSASAAIRSALAATDPSVQPVFSGRIADCIRLAGDLQRLMEEVETAEGDFAGLDALVPEALAAYWQISRQLVAIAAEAHPALLDERGLISTARLRNQRLAHEAERHRTRPAGVTIAAGSTGSIPATARLLAAIAAAPQGIVVLPGFDETLAPEARAALLEAGDEAAAHPQYGLQSLLNRLGAEPADVRMLGPEDRLASPRRRIVTHAFLPAAHHQPAPALDPGEAAAFDGLELIEAENEADEARAIAARLRLAIGEETLPAILVTPDRALARRVAAELDRYGIAADDSAGTPLMQTPEGILAALAARAFAEGFTPTLLLSLLKHPLAAFGLERAECRRRARLLERAALRGPAPAAGLEGLRAALSAHRRQRAEKARIAVLAKGLDATDDADIDDLIERIAEAFGPLSDQAFTERPLGETVLLLSETLCRISRGPDGEARILAGEAGEALAGLFSAIAASPDAGLAVAPRDLDPVLAALAAGLAVRPSRPADPRVQILGPLEARLLPASLTLLAGLEEGVWPAAATTDPFVSRAMRRALKLEPPERQIGLAAHDVEQVLCRQNVVLARARRSASAPLVPSRWWLRLEAALPEGVLKAARARGDAVLAAARDLDAAPGPARPALRPAPVPAPALKAERLSSLSVTEIETLIRDPYALYARHILKLEAAPMIGEEPDARDRGSLVHAVSEALVKDGIDPSAPDAPEALRAVIARVFSRLDAFPALAATWSARLSALVPDLLDYEAGRIALGLTRHAEASGAMTIDIAGEPFRLRGRADRIDLHGDGRVDIIDFKTGKPPSRKQVEAGLAPQLPMEMAMVLDGAFEGIVAAAPGDLIHVQIGAGRGGFKEQAQPAGNLHDKVRGELEALIALMRQEGFAFAAQRRPAPRRFAGDYDHLARLSEWGMESDADETG